MCALARLCACASVALSCTSTGSSPIKVINQGRDIKTLSRVPSVLSWPCAHLAHLSSHSLLLSVFISLSLPFRHSSALTFPCVFQMPAPHAWVDPSLHDHESCRLGPCGCQRHLLVQSHSARGANELLAVHGAISKSELNAYSMHKSKG